MLSIIKFLFSLLDDIFMEELLLLWNSGFVDPHQVPGFHVIPLFFNFVVSGPQESGVQVPIEGVESASGNRFNLGAVEEQRIASAGSRFDQSIVSHGWITERTICICFSSIWNIESLSFSQSHIWSGASNLLACILRFSIGCVEAT